MKGNALHFFVFEDNVLTVVSSGAAMQINVEYANFIMNAANVYACHRSTKCTAAECQFEAELLTLLDKACECGVEIQDIAVITSTAIAVALTKPPAHSTTKSRSLRLVESESAHMQSA